MEIPRHWRLKKQRYSLVGEICLDCDQKIFPPRPVCPNLNNHEKPTEIIFSSSRSPLYTSDNYMALQKEELLVQAQ